MMGARHRVASYTFPDKRTPIPFSKCIAYSWEDLFVYLRLLKEKEKVNEYLPKNLPAMNTYRKENLEWKLMTR